ncbi:MAG: serine protease [Polyangiales bacterium]
MIWFRHALVPIAALGFAGCVDPAPSAPTAQAAQPVIYGTDDRQDVYAHPDMNLRALAQQSIVALMRDTKVNVTNPANVTFNSTETLANTQNLCPGQRFENDPAYSDCSGTLIDNDIVLTAGHCFTAPGADAGMDGPSTCQNTRFVFKYYHEAAGRLATITADDVFSCAEIITRVDARNPDGTRQDYAFVRLNRSAAPRFTPAAVARTNGPTTVGQSITVIGFGSGIPAKIDSGGTVTDLRTMEGDFFEANVDTFSGNSGSGVFDTATRSMIGILVRGATDYVPADGGACNIANVCANTPGAMGCGGESVNRLRAAFDDFCTRLPMHRFCGGAGDAGATPTDAGTAPTDAPVAANDAGTAPTDAPVAANDAGTAPTDAPVAANDAGRANDTGGTSSGGGCATSPAPRTGGSFALALAALAVAARRRRARR